MTDMDYFAIGKTVFFRRIKATIVSEVSEYDGYVKIKLEEPIEGKNVYWVHLDNLELSQEADSRDFIPEREIIAVKGE